MSVEDLVYSLHDLSEVLAVDVSLQHGRLVVRAESVAKPRAGDILFRENNKFARSLFRNSKVALHCLSELNLHYYRL